ncbi:8dc2c281-2d3b-46c5-9076-6c1ff1bdf83d [Sclerotinia trifoliorum]|uniref:8dc2c281-2d3b-46c5-9076-6c1ff1bdf83d n=1 Tax=Sclerotinia trifoliorum TaxID=28548 RepID=A0A8H2ZSE4_9HELO|nr:8dc2c281-2d3b-46c5-9076-6c1ff1bdf83d [Sclerotinia trifoliorum]
MGIPHLITFLRPYATLSSLKGKHIVIDGPGLAYHIYHICLSARKSAGNYFEANPSYKELGETVLAWLDGLERSGAVVKQIYFDGFLPPAKLDVRYQRLSRNTQQLEKYHKDYASGLGYRFSSTSWITSASFPFAFAPQRSSFVKLPASSFLVPSIIEALQNTNKYRDIVEIVPGEADTYCASYVSQHGGIILTGDSDLLVHEIGTDSSVSFFQDVEVSSEADPWMLQSQVFHVGSIVKRLRLPSSHGICALAFEIVMDSHGTFSKLLKQATTLSAIKQHKGMYVDFVKEYLPVDFDLAIFDPTLVKRSSVKTALQALDPRVCEYVLQFPYLMRCLGLSQSSSASQDGANINIFLPFLIDCPSRTNAWEMSASIRQLAYGCMNMILPVGERRNSIFEHKRQANTSRGREWEIPAASDIPRACMEVLTFLRESRTKLEGQCIADSWSSIAFIQDAEWSESIDKVSLGKKVLAGLRASNPNDTSPKKSDLDWDKIHFMAQIQGSYYSFRILKQLTTFLILIGGRGSVSGPLLELNDLLQDLPSLNAHNGFEKLESMLTTMKESILEDSYQEKQLSASISAEKSKQKKKRKRDQLTSSRTANKKPTNPFDVLGSDW